MPTSLAALQSLNFFNLLEPERLTEIIDIGANPIDGNPPYYEMLAKGFCKVTGFEPQESALKILNMKKGFNERYLPYAIGDGNLHTIHICRASGMTSLLEPDINSLSLFKPFIEFGEVTQTLELSTQRLDDINEITNIDYLKIDIQGGELDVFNHAQIKLAQTVAIQTEVSFFPLYKNQPSLGEIDSALRAMNFIPHHLAELKRWPIAPTSFDEPFGKVHQLLEADIVYVKNLAKPESIETEQLKHLALIAHYCYGSYDLALYCIDLLEKRNSIAHGAAVYYQKILQA